MSAMKKLLASDRHPMSRRRIVRHAVASASLLVTGILVVGFAQMGGTPVSSTTLPDYGCSTPTTETITALAPAAFQGITTTRTATQPYTSTKYTTTRSTTRPRTTT